MPKYYSFLIADHYLYFTSFCIVEAMHVHAGDKELSEAGSAKFFVRADGSSKLEKRGDLKDNQITIIQKFIKENYVEMYQKWKNFGGGEFYHSEN
jgi:hypothetical protein